MKKEGTPKGNGPKKNYLLRNWKSQQMTKVKRAEKVAKKKKTTRRRKGEVSAVI